jgi:hypothetical protein
MWPFTWRKMRDREVYTPPPWVPARIIPVQSSWVCRTCEKEEGVSVPAEIAIQEGNLARALCRKHAKKYAMLILNHLEGDCANSTGSAIGS